jgi:hypothetical protein
MIVKYVESYFTGVDFKTPVKCGRLGDVDGCSVQFWFSKLGTSCQVKFLVGVLSASKRCSACLSLTF